MKVSEITAKDIANYLRLSEISEEDETLDTYSDFIIVVYVLCQDMYDNGVMYVDGKNINNTVKTILDMHTRNNL